MAIHFISGKPGGGKTLYAVNRIFEQLRDTNRQIVTNIVLDLDKLQEYCDSKDLKVFVADRVTILDEEQTKFFYLYRGRGVVVPCDPNPDVMPAFQTILPDAPGVAYFLDELHIFFNSREWAKTGKKAIFYLSQHRKLSDIVFCITQSINNVDKQFRSLAQDFQYIRNQRVEKFGMFRRGDGFIVKVYLSPLTGANDYPCEQASLSLDTKGLASCYNTAAGVGVSTLGKADVGSKVKGPKLVWFWSIIPVGLLVFWLLAHFGVGFLSKQASKTLTSGVPGSVSVVSHSSPGPTSSPDPDPTLEKKEGKKDKLVYWTGEIQARGHRFWYLSDGRVVSVDQVDKFDPYKKVLDFLPDGPPFKGLERVLPAPFSPSAPGVNSALPGAEAPGEQKRLTLKEDLLVRPNA